MHVARAMLSFSLSHARSLLQHAPAQCVGYAARGMHVSDPTPFSLLAYHALRAYGHYLSALGSCSFARRLTPLRSLMRPRICVRLLRPVFVADTARQAELVELSLPPCLWWPPPMSWLPLFSISLFLLGILMFGPLSYYYVVVPTNFYSPRW